MIYRRYYYKSRKAGVKETAEGRERKRVRGRERQQRESKEFHSVKLFKNEMCSRIAAATETATPSSSKGGLVVCNFLRLMLSRSGTQPRHSLRCRVERRAGEGQKQRKLKSNWKWKMASQNINICSSSHDIFTHTHSHSHTLTYTHLHSL